LEEKLTELEEYYFSLGIDKLALEPERFLFS